MDFSRHTSKDVVGYSKSVLDLKWNREGNYLGMASADKTVKVGQLDKSGAFQNVHSIPNSAIMTQVIWSPQDDSRIGMCGDDKSVELWDVRASRPSAKFISQGNNLSIAWSPCGTYLAVGNKSDVVQVFDVRTSAVCRRKKCPYEANELMWTANPNYLLTAGGEDGVGVLGLLSLGLQEGAEGAEGMEVDRASNSSSTGGGAVEELLLAHTVEAHVGTCVQLRTDPDRRRLAVGSLDNCVSLWALDDLVCTHNINVESEVRGLSFSGDGAFLAVVTEDPLHLLVCDTESGETVAKVPNKYKMNSVAWHPRLALLGVASEDRSPNPQSLRFVCFA